VARSVVGETLDRRTLNRTLLARQGLLGRVRRPALEVVEELVGLQAQEPVDPYVGLWNRIVGFDPDELATALVERRAVRMGMLRTTLHLVTPADATTLYPVFHDVLARAFRSSPFAKTLAGADIEAIAIAAREELEAEPLSPTELGRRLGKRWPELDATAMAYTARFLLPLVQVPPRGLWGQTGRATNTTAEAWLGGPLGPAASLEAIIRRYLRAFGPATIADIRIWSWLTGLRPVVDGMRPTLRTYRDEAGRELLDVEDGLIVEPDRPAPPRFLPQYDNVFLSHADRSRINGALTWGLDFVWKGPILVDGFITGTWRVKRERGTATMTVELGAQVDGSTRVALEEEAGRLFAFVAPDAEVRDLRVVGVT
jgi:DNA glycosylase AlkZ-like